MKARGMIFGMATSLVLGVPSLALAQDPPAAPSGGVEVVNYNDVREAEQADTDRRAAENADFQRLERVRRELEREAADLDELGRALDELHLNVETEEKAREQLRLEIIEENRIAEEEWRREEEERVNLCVARIDDEKRATIDQIRAQYDMLIGQLRGSGAEADVIAQFQRTRDQAIAGIVDGECEPLHERLRKQRNEEGVQRVRDGTSTPPPFVIRPAGTPRGN